MEYGTPLDKWIKRLHDMSDDAAARSFVDLSRGLCGSLLLLNAGVEQIHNDIKLENIAACEVVHEDPRLQVKCSGDLIFAPPMSRWEFKFIDHGSAVCNLPQASRGMTTPEWNCPLVAMCLKGLIDSIGNDILSMGKVLFIAANKGRDIFRDEHGHKTAPCPMPFCNIFFQGAELHRRGLAGGKRAIKRLLKRVAQALWEYFVVTHTKNQWVVKSVMKACPLLKELDQKLMANQSFREHVQKYALVDGTETLRIRQCRAFKSEKAAIDGFFHLLHPEPSMRWLPEVFLQVLNELEPSDSEP